MGDTQLPDKRRKSKTTRMSLEEYKSQQQKFREVVLKEGADVVTPQNVGKMLQVAMELATGVFQEVTIEGKCDYQAIETVSHDGYPIVPDFNDGSEVKVVKKFLKPDHKPITELINVLREWGVDPLAALRPKDADARVVETGIDLSQLSEEEKNQFLILMAKAESGKSEEFEDTDIEEDDEITDAEFTIESTTVEDTEVLYDSEAEQPLSDMDSETTPSV